MLTSAIGGWAAGILADRFGRVRILQYTILAYSLCTFIIGFTRSYEQFLTLRALQGLGFGGEWAVGAVLMREIIRPVHRGKALGSIQAGRAVGWGLAALVYVLMFSLLPADLAWRAMFWIGLLPGLLVLYIRRYVPEPEILSRIAKAHRQIRLNNVEMLFLGFPLGFAASGGFGSVGAFFTELFPSSVRANGQRFAYNFGRAIGAIFPGLVGFLSEQSSLAIAIGLFAGGAYALVFLATLMLPETRGRELS